MILLEAGLGGIPFRIADLSIMIGIHLVETGQHLLHVFPMLGFPIAAHGSAFAFAELHITIGIVFAEEISPHIRLVATGTALGMIAALAAFTLFGAMALLGVGGFLKFPFHSFPFGIADLTVLVGVSAFEEARVLRHFFATLQFHGSTLGVIELTITIEIGTLHHFFPLFRRNTVFRGSLFISFCRSVEQTD